MKRFIPSRSMAVAFAALVVAVAGIGGAADAAGVVHIGTNNINNGAVTQPKISQHAVGWNQLDSFVQKKVGKSGGAGPQGPAGPQGAAGKSVADETTSVVYNNLPSDSAVNEPSQSFEATGTSELGGEYTLAAGARTNPLISVELSSWACESGQSGSCVTADPGSTYGVPITLNIYSVGSGDTVGSLLATDTQTFEIPYRPSSDPTDCGSGSTAYQASNGQCYNGYPDVVTFDLGGYHVKLPDTVIVSVAYDTQNYGPEPTGETGPYDSLNFMVSSTGPSVGSDPNPGLIFDTVATNDTAGRAAGPWNVFAPDPASSNDWSVSGSGAPYYQPMIEVSTTG